ncbi:transmembrane protein 117-like [Physella acuta]|uniref:transmembrane protein 117-like n=1 Tax=Physella acuta TaxID=109671 RepID=UPI0027DB0145|nr:transmembrane protein 117-like [Physella acuta]
MEYLAVRLKELAAEPTRVTLEVVTKDDVATCSVLSLVMEKDFRYHFQHPRFRFFTAYIVTLCNFLIYAEDPIAHSYGESSIPVIGHAYSFIVTKWTKDSLSLVKFVFWFFAIVLGLLFGKIVIHQYFFNTVLRLKMFHDGRGSWMTMLFTTILTVFLLSYPYNAMLKLGGQVNDDYHITSRMGISNRIFSKVAATGTWCGDCFTAWMVTDIMLQEKLYPHWGICLRRWWNKGYNRIIVFWIVVPSCSTLVILNIYTEYILWDSINGYLPHTDEMSRSYLASFILVLDVTIAMQDWDFPHFVGSIDIKMPGFNLTSINVKIPKFMKSLEYWHIHISGKWFNYGILSIVILLDMNMWKNQMFYSPQNFGQYVDENNKIYTVTDPLSLEANSTVLSLRYRQTHINNLTGELYILGDIEMNSRYVGYPLHLKGFAFIPCLSIFFIFAVMIFIYGRKPKPTENNPYAGRLLKRKRRTRLGSWWLNLITFNLLNPTESESSLHPDDDALKSGRKSLKKDKSSISYLSKKDIDEEEKRQSVGQLTSDLQLGKDQSQTDRNSYPGDESQAIIEDNSEVEKENQAKAESISGSEDRSQASTKGNSDVQSKNQAKAERTSVSEDRSQASTKGNSDVQSKNQAKAERISVSEDRSQASTKGNSDVQSKNQAKAERTSVSEDRSQASTKRNSDVQSKNQAKAERTSVSEDRSQASTKGNSDVQSKNQAKAESNSGSEDKSQASSKRQSLKMEVKQRQETIK